MAQLSTRGGGCAAVLGVRSGLSVRGDGSPVQALVEVCLLCGCLVAE